MSLSLLFLFFRREPVGNPLVFALRQGATRHELTGIVVRTSRHYFVRLCLSDAGKTNQILPTCRVDVQRLVAAPSFAQPFSDRFRVTFELRRSLSGLLFHFPRILMRCASRQPSHQSHGEDADAAIPVVCHIFDLALWMKIGGRRLPRFRQNTVHNGLGKLTPGALQLAGEVERFSFTSCIVPTATQLTGRSVGRHALAGRGAASADPHDGSSIRLTGETGRLEGHSHRSKVFDPTKKRTVLKQATYKVGVPKIFVMGMKSF
jgi:hypothetical protein